MTWLPRRSSRIAALPAVFLPLLLLQPDPAGAQLPEPAQNATAGARVFGSSGCVDCHAVRGLGGQTGPDLGRIGEPRSFYDLAAAVWNHLPAMAERIPGRGSPRRRMSSRKAADLYAFLYTIDYFDPPGDPDTGRRLFVEKLCVMCHQIESVGGVVGPNLDFVAQYGSPIFVAAAMWNHGPQMAEEMEARGIERPTFEGRELLDLVTYLESATDAPGGSVRVVPGSAVSGRRLFSEKQCVRCHAAGGRGGDVGPDLGRRRATLGLTGFAQAMWNKAPGMRRAMAARGIEVPTLSADEMADLVAYLYAVGYFADSGRSSRGRALVESRGCLACHALGAAGGERASDLAGGAGPETPAGAVAALWNHVEVLEAGGDPWASVTSAEMADIVAFLLDPTRR